MSLIWAGLILDRPRVMGIVNVTPDSFSDGGRLTKANAIEAGLRMWEDEADIVDIGGESTNPYGSAPVSPDVEQGRIVPVIQALAGQGVRVSADTRHAATMAAALDAGASIVNDVSALTHDPASAALVAARGCPVILMHMRGEPVTMSALARYDDVAAEVAAEITARIEAATRAGVARSAIAIDPGFGFAKHSPHSITLLRRLETLTALGPPVVAGVSRKGFVGTVSGEKQPDRRFPGSIAAGLFAVSKGAAILRVHDVRETVAAVKMWCVLTEAGKDLPFPVSGR